MLKPRFFYFLIFLLALILTACAPAQAPNETLATETLNTEPDYSNFSITIYPGSCPGTWIEKKYFDNEYHMEGENPQYYGLYATINQTGDVQKDLELKTITATWLVTLKQIRINDRIIYPDSWTVIQELRSAPDSNTPVQELDPQPWIDKAKELTKLAPPIKVTVVGKWGYVEKDNLYDWVRTITCKVAK